MTESNSDYKQIEQSILTEIKSLKRDTTSNFLDTLHEKYIKLYNVRSIILKNEYIKLPKINGVFKSPQEEHYCAIQYFNYYHIYNTILVSHPIFYDFGKITEKRKIVNEINIINNKLQFLRNEISKLEK